MVQHSDSETERKLVAILRVLSESSEPLGSITIARELERFGVLLSERAVRYHLRITDERGYTQPFGNDGRMITTRGLEELKMALAPEQVGFILEKLELLAFQTTFDPEKKTGLIPVNTTLINASDYSKAMSAMRAVFKAEICVSDYMAIASEGEKIGSVIIPKGKIGLATMCSVVVNGVLLRAGVPTAFRFGGVLETKNYKPRRFIAIINYDGTSLDPSEQYIRAQMTSVNKAVETGEGNILAVFRTIPGPAKTVVEEKLAVLKDTGIHGICAMGYVSQPICQIPVGMNQVGMIMYAGLNPVAAIAEAGIEVDNTPESGLIDFQQLTSFWKL